MNQELSENMSPGIGTKTVKIDDGGRGILSPNRARDNVKFPD